MFSILLFASLVGALQATCGHSDCGSCVADSKCYWDAKASTCKSPLLSLPAAACLLATTNICDDYNCPKTPPFAYNETNAKLVYWRLQGAGKTTTDSSEFTACTTAADPNIQFVARFNVSCGIPLPTDYCTTDLYVVPSLEQVVAISMGSTGTTQITQVSFNLILPVFFNGQAIEYFVDSVENVWDSGLGAALATTLAAHPTYRFISSGHSLGGGMSLIIAAKVGVAGWRNKDQIETYTFGQPKIGNLKFMESLYQYAPRVYRVINYFDFVPVAPLTIFPLQHANWAVRYTAKMTGSPSDPRTICTYPQQSDCTYPFVEAVPNAENHNTYFGVSIPTWYQSGCVYPA